MIEELIENFKKKVQGPRIQQEFEVARIVREGDPIKEIIFRDLDDAYRIGYRERQRLDNIRNGESIDIALESNIQIGEKGTITYHMSEGIYAIINFSRNSNPKEAILRPDPTFWEGHKDVFNIDYNKGTVNYAKNGLQNHKDIQEYNVLTRSFNITNSEGRSCNVDASILLNTRHRRVIGFRRENETSTDKITIYVTRDHTLNGPLRLPPPPKLRKIITERITENELVAHILQPA